MAKRVKVTGKSNSRSHMGRTIRVHLLDTVTGEPYVASGVNAMYSGWEVLVFRADHNGNPITAGGEIAGGRSITHEEAIEELEHVLNNPNEEAY